MYQGESHAASYSKDCAVNNHTSRPVGSASNMTGAANTPRNVDNSMKNLVHPLYGQYHNFSLLRQLTTRGFTTRYIAVGEQTLHRIPHVWINKDLTQADIEMDFAEKRCLPFADSSQSAIYSSHMVEHVDPELPRAPTIACTSNRADEHPSRV
jgi:hypothetical protein